MPSLLHEGLIALVRDKPEFAADLLRELLHVEVPKFTEARLAEATLTELVPTEYHADAVVLLVDGKPVFGIIIEAQLQEDARKRFTWPVYAINARARFECPFVVVVVTPDAATARWASLSIELGGGKSWEPFVVGPDGIPVITDPARARREPELTVLSVIAARKAFEMHPQGEKFFSESQRRSVASARAADVLDVLDARGLTVSDAQRERILGCSDLEVLKAWLRRAATVATADALFT
jgi:hypothetical protein